MKSCIQLKEFGKKERRQMFKTQIDTFLTTGTTHDVCQDFIVSQMEPYPAIVLCDGCSSSPGSELGAQLISRTFLTNLNRHPDLFKDNIRYFLNSVYSSVDIHRGILGASEDILYCTLLYIVNMNNRIYANVVGDGCVFVVEKMHYGTHVTVHKYDFSNSMPCYFCYEYLKLKDIYLQYCENDYRSSALIQFLLDKEEEDRSPFITKDEITERDWNHILFPPLYANHGIENVVAFGIASDGLSSFMEKSKRKTIDTKDVLKNMLLFKSTNGEFLKRRAKRMVQDYSKENIYPLDDFSCGVMLFDKSEENE